MKTKAVIFDAYGTLFDVNSAAEKCKDKIGDKWEAFANFWRTTQLEYTWLRSLMKRHKDFWQITEDSLNKSMKVFKIDKSMKNELLNLYKVLSPYPEVKEVLENLKKKNLKIAILSNGTPSLLNELANSSNLKNLFNDLFSVEEVKVYKPDSKVYEKPVKTYRKTILIQGLMHAFGEQNRGQIGFENGIHFRMHVLLIVAPFGGHFGAEQITKLAPKLDETLDSNLD